MYELRVRSAFELGLYIYCGISVGNVAYEAVVSDGLPTDYPPLNPVEKRSAF